RPAIKLPANRSLFKMALRVSICRSKSRHHTAKPYRRRIRQFAIFNFHHSALWVLLVIVLVSAGFRFFDDGRLTPQERRGRELYLRGTSPSGKKISAVMGNSGTEIPASSIACANCHGREGLGKTEGGVSPSNLTWDSLTRPYTVTAPSGRQHPAYDDASLKRAITMGFDPAGNELQAAMPRFSMSMDDMSDLIAYIKKLGKSLDPGVTSTTLHLGAVVPVAGPLSEMGRAVRAVIEAYFEELNRQGGIFGRKVELVVMSAGTEEVRRSIAGGH